jgi:hypothetical protein
MKKLRDSNMELLRIVAMLLVMTVHASYRALPRPDDMAVAIHPLSVFLQLSTICFTVIGVDVFVMLSGWYGIRPRVLRLGELLFQILFFGLLCLGIEYAVSGQVPPKAVTSVLILNDDNYWFVKTYLALYLLAPVLNAFVEIASRRQFEQVLIGLFGFQFVFGWVFDATTWLRAGYSLPSFVCLYLLARYMRVHRPWFTQFNLKTDLAVYLGSSAFLAVSTFTLRHFNLGGFLYFYNSPLVILGAAYLLLFFSKLSFQSRLVNWIAVSALAIYLLHSNCYLSKYYDHTILNWFLNEPRHVLVFNTAWLIICVFAVSILIDKVRIALWSPIAQLWSAKEPLPKEWTDAQDVRRNDTEADNQQAHDD